MRSRRRICNATYLECVLCVSASPRPLRVFHSFSSFPRARFFCGFNRFFSLSHSLSLTLSASFGSFSFGSIFCYSRKMHEILSVAACEYIRYLFEFIYFFIFFLIKLNHSHMLDTISSTQLYSHPPVYSVFYFPPPSNFLNPLQKKFLFPCAPIFPCVHNSAKIMAFRVGDIIVSIANFWRTFKNTNWTTSNEMK